MRRSLSTFTVDQLSIAGEWEDRSPLTYTAEQFKARARRKASRAALDRDAPPATDESRLFRELAAERRRSRDAAVQRRWEIGYVHRGGGVGGNPAYWRPPFVFKGLVSDEAAILKLFVTKTPRAHRLLTGTTKDIVEGTDSKLLALDSEYVTANARMRGVIRVDIDVPLDSWAAVSAMCDRANIPVPNVAVGHVDTAGRILNPHLIWIIANSVAFTPKARKAPQRFFLGVQRGLTAALVPHGADQVGYPTPCT